MLRICSVILWCGVCCTQSFAADQSSAHKTGLRENIPQVWALQHATVVTSPGRQLDDATVVIRDGRIHSISFGGEVPTDARVLDFSGRTLYPGFIDSYSETDAELSEGERKAGYWNPNVVPELSLSERAITAGSASELRKQGIVAQLRAPAKRVVRGRSVLVSTGTDDASHAVLAADVAQHLELTVNSRSRTVYPGSPMGAVALARQAIYDAIWYRDAWQAANSDPKLPRPETNASLAALKPVLTGQQPVMIETSNEQFALRAEAFAAEFGLNLLIRGSGREYRRLNEISGLGRAIILPLNFSKPPNVSSAEVASGVTLESLMHWDLAPENPGKVAAAGVRLAFATDRLPAISDFLKQLRTAVARGLSEDDALKALTVTPSELFKVSDQLGSLEAGKLASFVVTNGNVFDKKTQVLETWVDGLRFEHEPNRQREPTGMFELIVKGGSPLPARLYLELKRSDKKVSGRISRTPFEAPKDSKSEAAADKAEDTEDKSDSKDIVSLKKPELNDFVATAQFPGKDWGIDGVMRFTLIFSDLPQATTETKSGLGTLVLPTGQTLAVSATAWSPPEPEAKAAEAVEADKDAGTDDQAADDSDAEKTEAEKPSRADFAVNFPLGAFGREAAPEAVGPTAFINATLWTCGPDGVIEGGTLLIDNGLIVAAGRDLQLPDGVRKIDVRGMHISPGIIDCHSHMATDGGVNESTQSITCEVRVGDFVDANDITIYRQLAGGVTASNILHGSANPIGGQNQVIKLRWGATGQQMKFAEAPPGVKFALGENVKQSNWGEQYRTRYPQTRMGVEQTFRDAFEAAKEYGRRHDAWQSSRRGLPPRRDLELDALREIVEQRRWIHCHSYRQDEILALIRVLDEYDITIGTFQHILEGYKVADEMAKHGAMGSAFADWWAYKFEVFDAIPFGGALMHDAGVTVSFNSDDGELATHLNQEAAKAVKYGGVAPEEALKFVTLNPAKQLRIDKYVGALQPGLHADFVVWSGSPLSNYSRCEQTWIDGARYFDREEDVKARAQVSLMRNQLIQKILASGESMRGVDEADDDPSAMWVRHDEYCRAHAHRSH